MAFLIVIKQGNFRQVFVFMVFTSPFIQPPRCQLEGYGTIGGVSFFIIRMRKAHAPCSCESAGGNGLFVEIVSIDLGENRGAAFFNQFEIAQPG